MKKKIILFLICFTGLRPVIGTEGIHLTLLQVSYADGYGSEEDDDIAFCAGAEFYGSSICQVMVNCNTGSVISIVSCIDTDDDDNGGGGGGDDDWPCYYNCDGDDDDYDDDDYDDDLDCAGVPGGYAYDAPCGCIGGSTGIAYCPEPEPDPTDCNGVVNGNAFIADCGCIGGTTGITECPLDPCDENVVPPVDGNYVLDILGVATAHASVYPEAFEVADGLRTGTLVPSWNNAINGIIDRNYVDNLLADLNGSFQGKGLAILSSAGKLIGLGAIIENVIDLTRQYDVTGSLCATTLADFGINAGSLAIKSNFVGFGISAGWLIIKETF